MAGRGGHSGQVTSGSVPLTLTELMAMTEQVSLLRSMPDPLCQGFVRLCQPMAFTRGQTIITQEEYSATLYIVLSGRLHVKRQTTDGKIMLLGRLGPGAIFGEISLFDPGKTTASVCAVGEGMLLTLGRQGLKRFVREQPRGANLLMARLLGDMAKRMRTVDQRLCDAPNWGVVEH